MICSVCARDLPAGAFRRHACGAQMGYCTDCHLAKRRAIHARTKDRVNAKQRAKYGADADYRKAYADRRRERYAKVGRASLIEWEQANPERARDACRKKMARYRASLTDSYIARLLVQHGGPLLAGDIPQTMIEAKRLQLMIERAINEKHE